MKTNEYFKVTAWLMAMIQLFIICSAIQSRGQDEDPVANTSVSMTLGDIEKMLFSSEVLQERARFYHSIASRADGNGVVNVTAAEQAVLSRRFPGLSPVQKRVNELAAAMREKVELQSLVDQIKTQREARDALLASRDADLASLDTKRTRRDVVVAAITGYQSTPPANPAQEQEFTDYKAERLTLNDEISTLTTRLDATRASIKEANSSIASLRDRIDALRN